MVLSILVFDITRNHWEDVDPCKSGRVNIGTADTARNIAEDVSKVLLSPRNIQRDNIPRLTPGAHYDNSAPFPVIHILGPFSHRAR